MTREVRQKQGHVTDSETLCTVWSIGFYVCDYLYNAKLPHHGNYIFLKYLVSCIVFYQILRHN